MKTLVLAVLAALTFGCASAQSIGKLDRRSQTFTVNVENQNTSDYIVHVSRYGRTFRIGRVTSLSTRKLQLPRTMVFDDFVHFVLVSPFMSGQNYELPTPVVLDGSDRVDIRIMPQVTLSYVVGWNE